MSRKSSIIRYIVNAAIFIILEVAALAMLYNNGQLQRIWISKASHTFMAGVWGSSQKVGDYFNLIKVNNELAQENFDLLTKLAQSKKEEKESLMAKDVVIGDFKFTSAEIIKFSKNSNHNYLILDKGKVDGVVVNSGIITRMGAVGIVESVSDHYSYAIAFTNHNISISTRVGKEGVVGPLSWDGIHSNRGILKEIPLHIDIQPGDTVFTSGHSSFFPADIPLGRAMSTEIVNGSTQNIDIDLFQDFKSLRYVTIVNNIYQDELDKLDK